MRDVTLHVLPLSESGLNWQNMPLILFELLLLSARLSNTRTVLSSQPIPRWYGVMGFRLIDVTAFPQSIRISCVKRNHVKLEAIFDPTVVETDSTHNLSSKSKNY